MAKVKMSELKKIIREELERSLKNEGFMDSVKGLANKGLDKVAGAQDQSARKEAGELLKNLKSALASDKELQDLGMQKEFEGLLDVLAGIVSGSTRIGVGNELPGMNEGFMDAVKSGAGEIGKMAYDKMKRTPIASMILQVIKLGMKLSASRDPELARLGQMATNRAEDIKAALSHTKHSLHNLKAKGL